MAFRGRNHYNLAMDCPYRLLVFDWDGTLMDSISSIVACMQATVERLGMESIPDERIRRAIGLGLHDTLDMLVPGADERLRGRILDCYRQLWFSSFRERPVPFSGVPQALTALAAADHLMAVATGKGRRGLDRDFDATGMGRLFHASRTADETFSKPHPRMLEEILDELGARPDEALMVGDTTYDLEMARNAGVAAVAVTCGSHRREELAGLEPLACLGSVLELEGWLRPVPVT